MDLPPRAIGRSASQRCLAIALGVLLLAASLMKLWSDTRYPQQPQGLWIEGAAVDQFAGTAEAALGFVLLAGLWPRPTRLLAVSLFSLFAAITAAETIRGKPSCGCFGAVHVRPIYTMSLDLMTVALLLITGRPGRGSEVAGRGSGRRRMYAGAAGIAWVGIVLGMWLTRAAIAVAGTATQGQTFGKPGELVVLEPEKWPGRRFGLSDHIDIGSQLMTGQWIVLLVHHDCDHCAAAMPKYLAEYGGPVPSSISDPRPTTSDPRPRARLAVIEMPPFAEAGDPPPWQLPPSVLSGRLDQTRDWFATTPVAVLIKDGIIISAKESAAAEMRDPSW